MDWIMTPSLPLTVMDLPLGVKSRTYAYSSYFLGWPCSPWLKCPAAVVASCVDGAGVGGGCCPDNVQALLRESEYLTLSIFPSVSVRISFFHPKVNALSSSSEFGMMLTISTASSSVRSHCSISWRVILCAFWDSTFANFLT